MSNRSTSIRCDFGWFVQFTDAGPPEVVMSVMLTVYQTGMTEAAAVFLNAPAVPRVGDWFRFTGVDGRTYKGLVSHVEWLAYTKEGQSKMTAGIFLDHLVVI